VDDGDHVDIGDTIADIMMEKTQIEIEAPASGIIRLRAAPEQPLRKGDTIAVIET
jgi:pyruvate/2-oxoglutarate dehydrogenase complex dihydrolipoamide acyltransferase (E2) component